MKFQNIKVGKVENNTSFKKKKKKKKKKKTRLPTKVQIDIKFFTVNTGC